MQRRFRYLTLLCLAFALSVGYASAQEAPGVMVRVLQVEVIPARAAEYEQAVIDLFGLYKKHGVSTPINAGVSGFNYGYISVVGDLDGLQKQQDETAALAQAEGSKFQGIIDRINAASINENTWDASYRADLSYTPSNPRLQPGEAGVTRFFYYHLPRGGENVAADRAMEAAKLWGAKGLTMGFDTYVAITGSDLPLVLVGIQGKNLVDLLTEFTMNQQKLGEEGVKLNQRIFETTRRFDQRDYVARPDMSYVPGN